VGTGLVTDVLLREHGSLSKNTPPCRGSGTLPVLVTACRCDEHCRTSKTHRPRDRGTGTLVIVAAYATSLLLVERLFRIVKPS
jgi:hypothetical protein